MICKLSNVRKGYDNKIILNDFNLEVNQGEKVAIIGKSGAGKSTILNIIGLLDRPEAGETILFDDNNPWRKRQQYMRYKISYLLQNYGLIENENIIENLNIALAYVKKTKKEKRILIRTTLNSVGLQHLSGVEKICTLSGGEQQRVALARALIKPSELILADEPTGSLDTENRDAFLDLLSSSSVKDKTVIIVTHDNAVALRCDRIVRI